MRVLHVPFGYYPDAVGGTEVYVAQLVRALRSHGVESAVAAPAGASPRPRYEHEGTPVHRFDTSASLGAPLGVDATYGCDDPVATASLDAVIGEVAPDILHLHAFTSAASVAGARAGRLRGAAVVFTYHTPTVSCVRGTLLRHGHEVCDGTLDAGRCAACLLDSRGVPPVAREIVGRLPAAFGRAAARTGASGRWVTAVRARELTASRHVSLRALLEEADAVVAVCDWVRTLLLGAGAPAERVHLVRQGTEAATSVAPDRIATAPPVRLAFLGRLDPVKGAHVVLEALAADRALPLTLDVFGIVEDERSDAYRARVERLAAGDSRIAFHAAVSPRDVTATLRRFDALVVPSQWLETGPLVVLEAFAAQVPVIGSRLGGIAELVRHEHDGLLVPHDSPEAWRRVLGRVAREPETLDALRAGIRPPRTVADVAADMVRVYREVRPRDVAPLPTAEMTALSSAGGAT